MRRTSKVSGSGSESLRGFVVVALLAAIACAGPAGPPGPAGPGGPGGDAGTPGTAGPIDYGVLTPAELEVAKITGQLTGVTIPADGRPVVTVKVTERHGSGLRGMSATAVNWRFALIKLTQGVNGSANDSWVSYMAANDHSVASTETATTTALTDNGDGTYTYKFTKAINAGTAAAGTVYEPSKVHRLVVLLYATGNPFSPVNIVQDFIPATGADVTGQNEKIDQTACLECHTQFRAIAGATGELGTGEFHGGVRYDVRTCAACHNDQKRYVATTSGIDSPAVNASGTWTGNMTVINNEAFLNLPVFVHKIHMGEDLKMTGGTYTGFSKPYEVTYPQDVRNCVKCHRSTTANPVPLADNWKNQPSKRACNACHDDISFVNPPPNGRRLHPGGEITQDGNCLLCHSSGGPAGDIPNSHIPVSAPNPNNIYVDQSATGNSNTNAAYVAAAGAVPPGAKVIVYDVKSVSPWDDSGVKRPQIVFKFKLGDGVNFTDVVFPNPTAATELIPNFVGSPSAYFAFAVPQDGKVAPADFNATGSAYIRNVWNGSGTCSNVPASATTSPTGAGTVTGPDSSGYYTMQLKCVVIPANASMLTGGIGYTYNLGTVNASDSTLNFINNNQPLTQINLPAYPYTPNDPNGGKGGKGGLIVPALDVWKVATGYTGRRADPTNGQQKLVVVTEKCDACHVELQLLPQAEPDRQRVVGKPEGLRAQHPWRRKARRSVHLARKVERRRLLEDDVSGGTQPVRDVPPARHVRLQHRGDDQRVAEHAVQHRRPGHLRGQHPEQRAFALRDRGDELWSRVQLQPAHRRQHRGGIHDARHLADRRRVLRVPRQPGGHRSHADERRVVLEAARRGPERHARGAVPDLPRPEPGRGDQLGAHRQDSLRLPCARSRGHSSSCWPRLPARRRGRSRATSPNR